jgi:hypothetical protein
MGSVVTLFVIGLVPLALSVLVAWGVFALTRQLPAAPRAALVATTVALGTPCLFVGGHAFAFMPPVVAPFVESGHMWMAPGLISIAVVWATSFAIARARVRRESAAID